MLTMVTPYQTSPGRQKAQIWLWNIVIFIMFSVLISIFRVKNRGKFFFLRSEADYNLSILRISFQAFALNTCQACYASGAISSVVGRRTIKCHAFLELCDMTSVIIDILLDTVLLRDQVSHILFTSANPVPSALKSGCICLYLAPIIRSRNDRIYIEI